MLTTYSYFRKCVTRKLFETWSDVFFSGWNIFNVCKGMILNQNGFSEPVLVQKNWKIFWENCAFLFEAQKIHPSMTGAKKGKNLFPPKITSLNVFTRTKWWTQGILLQYLYNFVLLIIPEKNQTSCRKKGATTFCIFFCHYRFNLIFSYSYYPFIYWYAKELRHNSAQKQCPVTSSPCHVRCSYIH